VPPGEGTTYNFWHATEYLDFGTTHKFLAAFNDGNESISYTQMGDAPPYLFTGLCPEVAGVGDPAIATATPRLFLTGLRPARSQIGLRIELPARARVQLAIYDVVGRRVRTLVDGELPAGPTEQAWDGSDESGTLVSSG